MNNSKNDYISESGKIEDNQDSKTRWLPLLLLPVFFLLGWLGNDVAGTDSRLDQSSICGLINPDGTSQIAP